MDHVEGLRKIADKSEQFATKAAETATFVAREIYATEWNEQEWEALLGPLKSVLGELVSNRVRPFDPLRALNGSTFDDVGADLREFLEWDAQWSLYHQHQELQGSVDDPWEWSRNKSANAELIQLCKAPGKRNATMCILQFYGSIFGVNCSASYISLCPLNERLMNRTIPRVHQQCVNERIARVSNNESTLNRLAIYTKRNVFLAFNFISFCAALNKPYDGVIPDSVQIVRSIADGFALSKQEIESISWPSGAKVVAARTLTSAALKRTDDAYNRTAHEIVSELKYTWLSHEYCAVVYYSYTGPLKSDVVFYNDSKNDSFDETAEATQLFVQRYKAEDAVQWKNIEVDSKTLAVLFDDDEPSTSMTERFRKAKLDAKLFDVGGFRAAAVIPCAYRFVWYELVWQYFHAYGTTSRYVLTFERKNAYNQCGDVVLFP